MTCELEEVIPSVALEVQTNINIDILQFYYHFHLIC